MTEKVSGIDKEKLLEDMQWTHERLKTGTRVTSAKNELSEWINRIKEGKFDTSVVSVEHLEKEIDNLECINTIDVALEKEDWHAKMSQAIKKEKILHTRKHHKCCA